MWQGQRFRGSEAAESIFCEVSAALTCHRRAHSQKPLVRRRAFAPAVPLRGFSGEKRSLLEASRDSYHITPVPRNKNAKNTHPLRCKLAQGLSVSSSQRPSPLKQLQMETSLPSINAARCAAPDGRARVYGDSTQMLHPSSAGLFLAR